MPKITNNEGVLELGQLLRRRREAIGMSRTEMAEKIGTRYDVIRLYEEGQRIMRIDRLFDILKALNLHLSENLSVNIADTAKVEPKAYQMAERLSTLDTESFCKLMRIIQSLIDAEESGQ